ncbi:hypothetical protein ACU686_00995 [Yinghuangia aomiensis]
MVPPLSWVDEDWGFEIPILTAPHVHVPRPAGPGAEALFLDGIAALEAGGAARHPSGVRPRPARPHPLPAGRLTEAETAVRLGLDYAERLGPDAPARWYAIGIAHPGPHRPRASRRGRGTRRAPPVRRGVPAGRGLPGAADRARRYGSPGASTRPRRRTSRRPGSAWTRAASATRGGARGGPTWRSPWPRTTRAAPGGRRTARAGQASCVRRARHARHHPAGRRSDRRRRRRAWPSSANRCGGCRSPRPATSSRCRSSNTAPRCAAPSTSRRHGSGSPKASTWRPVAARTRAGRPGPCRTRRGGGRPRRACRTGIEALTARRTPEPPNFVVRGLSNTAIAGELAVRLGTVQKHLTAIYAKLGTDRDGLGRVLHGVRGSGSRRRRTARVYTTGQYVITESRSRRTRRRRRCAR